ncbi:WD40 repeat-like protein [Coniophora puteana RWD-64-598 SS2]|uniref:WD40 repeat-like protein n=1 Tax=Coniophora puteana (strain RWD-64-598) TaxID=741705 RepID=A0A5M3N1C0_CONPW|nr:WD40 repeat-like protein [Coniophora puteana RWD-64-598 SS2]EIW84695.1 WD40 repeat-like protein [Coniophora puteana RWD-64-598 SS2]
MPRTLRPRKSHPSYAALGGFEDENGAGPSTFMEDEVASEDEFSPDKAPSDDEDVEMGDVQDEEATPRVSKSKTPKPKAQTKKVDKATPAPNPPSITPSTYTIHPAPSVPRHASQSQPPTMLPSSAPSARTLAPRTSKMYSLPTPSAHHRHKAIPLHARTLPVERLAHPPPAYGFGPGEIVPTNSMAASTTLTDRINRAWGSSVGAGPVWQMMEDRGWFKEAQRNNAGTEGVEREALRRPRVHEGVEVGKGWQILNERDAATYLPSADPSASVDANADATPSTAQDPRYPPPLKCHFGKFGEQKLVEVGMLDTLDVSTLIPNSTGHVFNAGAPVWALDWCPVHVDHRHAINYKHYLAISPYPYASYSPSIGSKLTRPAPACIQIWSISPRSGILPVQEISREADKPKEVPKEPSSPKKPKGRPKGSGKNQRKGKEKETETDTQIDAMPEPEADVVVMEAEPQATAEEAPETGVAQDSAMSAENPVADVDTSADSTSHSAAEMRCELILCIDGGPAHDLRWCPLPAHDCFSEDGEQSQERVGPRKLGILAACLGDGSLSIWAVPFPDDVVTPEHDRSKPVFLKLGEPRMRIEMPETACWSLDWANSEMLAVGCTNGCIAIYDVGNAFKHGHGPDILPTHYLPTHQSAVRALSWVRVSPSSSSGEDEGEPNDPTVLASGGYDGTEVLTDIREVKGYVVNRTRDVITSSTFSPFASGPIMIDHDNTVKAYALAPSMLGRGHVLVEPAGPVWTVNASDYHPQLAVGSADGSCVTTNILRSTRRGGLVPHFNHKIYQLDYSRSSGEYRMLENFLPKESDETTNISTGAWSPSISVTRVAWHSGAGLAGACLLASSTASGLCRVDWLVGRWHRDRVPYVDVPRMRGEVEGAVEVEEESD